MEQGRDEESSEAISKTVKSPLRINRWKMIQSDGIFTPWRAYERRGTLPNCGFCRNEQCDLEHLLWECQETQLDKTPQFEWLRKQRDKAPDQQCLWNTGNVGKGFIHYPQSKQMQATEQYDRPETLTQEHVTTVYTDGGMRESNRRYESGIRDLLGKAGSKK